MGVEFKKTGVISAGGDVINPNLLAIQLDNTHWPAWGYDIGTREKVIINGKTWAHVAQGSEETRYGGFYCDPAYNLIVIDPTKRYTWSCTAMAGNATNAEIILWNHWRSTEGGANLAQYTQRFNLTKEPTRIIWTMPQYTHATYTVNRINLMMGSYKADNEIYFTDVKFEEGTTGTAWLPHENEIGSINGGHGMIERTVVTPPSSIYEGHIEAVEFIEF